MSGSSAEHLYEGTQPGAAPVLVSDASVEAERLVAALRARGLGVIDVPLGLLLSRVRAALPAFVVCDADALGAVEAIRRIRATAVGDRLPVAFLCEPAGTGQGLVERLADSFTFIFPRPVDLTALVSKVEQLSHALISDEKLRASVLPKDRAPVVVAPARRHPSSEFVAPPLDALSSIPYAERESEPPRSDRPSVTAPEQLAPPPSMRGSGADWLQSGRLALAARASLSPDLLELLSSASAKVRKEQGNLSAFPERLPPEAELDALLPEEVLKALDEPVEIEDDEDSNVSTHGGSESGTRTGNKSTPSGPSADAKTRTRSEEDRAREKTSEDSVIARERPAPPPFPGASQQLAKAPTAETVGMAQPSLPAPTEIREAQPLGSASAFPGDSAGKAAEPALLGPPPGERATTRPPRPRASTNPERNPERPRPAEPVVADSAGPKPVTDGVALHLLARSVSSRFTGALAFELGDSLRRVVFRDGDFVTLAASAPQESLVSFLMERGDLPLEAGNKLVRKLPQFGRHAGAALIAQGHLRQDDLWSVLRAHAEWLLIKVLRMGEGTASEEPEVPARLQSEPAVFGGTTGAEVLVEVVRRAVPPAEALKRLGGSSARLGPGPCQNVLNECGLSDFEATLLRSAHDETVETLLTRAGTADFVCVIYAARELGILQQVSGTREAPVTSMPPPPSDHLDEAAFVAKIRARRALVDEGDYFAILGVTRTATGYDIRHAYSELKEQFKPSLTAIPLSATLAEDVAIIVDVIEEAYEILRDPVRRERYRKALEAAPR